ncbi:defender against death DAD protein [Gonapodya prolifera JEL478]|uniref:Dolichyl-diphosphooligosaccharide--protein glycosyltransferase subunit OST2 n=1 Tax=Gonapodya prolifera (strain JEL478) TaxID=1344416 RepID=A0A139AEA5_GONPJ|nr:defender against death DAD protein [Gonapodya prolifera JEL478]|eukprot:KXS15121.1 defender against death DAD protein [Gonapodya prolifera JEL478]
MASTRSNSSTSSQSALSASLSSHLLQALETYRSRTPARLKFVDAYLAFLVLTGVLQFVYVLLVGNYPFNSFLAGFGGAVGSFVLAASLRIQISGNNPEFKDVSPERAIAEFIFAQIVLHFFVINYLG